MFISYLLLIAVSMVILLSGLLCLFLYGLKRYEAMQERLLIKQAKINQKHFDGIKAHVKTLLNNMPGKMGKEARELVDYLVREEIQEGE
jgi:hypothetical protein